MTDLRAGAGPLRRRSGCRSSTHDDSYGFAARAGLELHLVVVADRDPAAAAPRSTCTCPTPTRSPRAWAGAGDDRRRPTSRTAVREGSHVDPDGNLLRFGSPLASGGVTAEIRWGIVGPGRIAEKVVEDFAVVDGRPCRSPSPPGRSTAPQAFAARHGIERAHGSYAEILADPDVDVLYVATPHPQHHAIALAALRAGKALLVEKAFTATRGRRRARWSTLARQTGVFAWRRCGPASSRPSSRLRELIADGAIGEVRSVQADLGVAARRRPRPTGCSPWRSAAARCSTSASTSSRSRRCCSATPDARDRRRLAVRRPASTPRRPCCSATATAGRRR